MLVLVASWLCYAVTTLEKDGLKRRFPFVTEDFFEKFPNAKTFPQIILNGEKIGGYHELEKWFEMNTFDEEF